MKIDRLRTFMSRDKDRPRMIVAVDTSDGITGWGECYNCLLYTSDAADD